MSEHRDEDTSTFPALGRLLTWVDRPGSAMKLVWALLALCVLTFALGFTYDSHGHFDIEHFGGFYAIYGFVMFTGLILAARGLRVLVKRPEDYYAPHAIDAEDYPEDQLERQDHDG